MKAYIDEQQKEKLNIWVSPKEREKLDLYLIAEKKSMVDWAREKISELPEYKIIKSNQKTG